MSENCEYCILTSEMDIIEYEKAVYLANQREKYKNDNYLDIYNIVDGCRASLRISYNNTKIFAIKKNGQLLAGIAFNFDLKKMQLELRGFSIEKEDNICEAFGLCTLKTRDDEIGFVGEALTKFSDNQVKMLGVKKIYATATERMARRHQQRGAQVLAENCINGVNWYLVCYEVK